MNANISVDILLKVELRQQKYLKPIWKKNRVEKLTLKAYTVIPKNLKSK